jgi:hypothetical protein
MQNWKMRIKNKTKWNEEIKNKLKKLPTERERKERRGFAPKECHLLLHYKKKIISCPFFHLLGILMLNFVFFFFSFLSSSSAQFQLSANIKTRANE